MQVLNGKETAKNITDEISVIVKKRKAEGKKIPHLAAILIGTDGGSMTYINNKLKACESCGFESTLMRYDDSVTEEVILNKIHSLNEDKSIDGFIVQLPLPIHIDETKVILAIDPLKDVDGFHPMNLGKMACLTADILIAALGQANFVSEDMVKEGAVVIDVGITRVDDSTKANGWRLVGDVQYDKVAEKCLAITPVPGGVGPMTIASLMMNTLKAMDLKGK